MSDESFYRLACRLLREDARRAGGLLHIATHDPRLADRLAAFIDEHGIPKSAYEYAMLYGIQRPLQQRLVQAGRPLRVLVAYGEYWFPWYMRPPRRAPRERLVRRQERLRQVTVSDTVVDEPRCQTPVQYAMKSRRALLGLVFACLVAASINAQRRGAAQTGRPGVPLPRPRRR